MSLSEPSEVSTPTSSVIFKIYLPCFYCGYCAKQANATLFIAIFALPLAHLYFLILSLEIVFQNWYCLYICSKIIRFIHKLFVTNQKSVIPKARTETFFEVRWSFWIFRVQYFNIFFFSEHEKFEIRILICFVIIIKRPADVAS